MKQVINATDNLPISLPKINANFTELYDRPIGGDAGNPRGNLDDAVSVRATNSLAFSAGVAKQMLFDTKDNDVNNRFASNAYTVAAAGWYQLTCLFYTIVTGGAGTEIFAELFVNGVARKRLADVVTVTVNQNCYAFGVGSFYLNAGDVLTLWTTSTATGDTFVAGGSLSQPQWVIVPL